MPFGRALPDPFTAMVMIEGEHLIDYNTNIPIGRVPKVMGRFSFSALSAAIAMRIADSGADGSNYTQCEIRMGTAASYSTLFTLDTSGAPGAMVQVSDDDYVGLDSGALIFAYWTRTGTAQDYAGEEGFVSLELVAERLP